MTIADGTILHALRRLQQYDAFEIHGCIRMTSDSGQVYYDCAMSDLTPDVWSVYGHLPGGSASGGIECLADCESESDAIFIKTILEIKRNEI